MVKRILVLFSVAGALGTAAWYFLAGVEEDLATSTRNEEALMAEIGQELVERLEWADNYECERASWDLEENAENEGVEPIDQETFDGLLEGYLSECMAAATVPDFDRASGTRVVDGVEEFWDWDTDRGDGTNLPGDGFDYRSVRRPESPADAVPADVLAVEAACEGLDEMLVRIAATPDLCTSLGFEEGYLFEEGGYRMNERILASRRFGWAVSVRARKAQREGRNGFIIIERGLIALRDMRRGPTSFLQAMIVVVAEGILMDDYAALLVPEREVSETEVERRQSALRAVLNASPPPRALIESNLLAVQYNPNFREEDKRRALQIVHYTRRDVCEYDDMPFRCLERMRPSRASFRAMIDPVPPTQMQAEFFDALYDNGIYIRRLASNDARLRLLTDLVATSHARADGCPPVPPPLSAPPWSTDAASITALSGHMYRLAAAPSHLLEERAAILVLCPVPAATWAPAE